MRALYYLPSVLKLQQILSQHFQHKIEFSEAQTTSIEQALRKLTSGIIYHNGDDITFSIVPFKLVKFSIRTLNFNVLGKLTQRYTNSFFNSFVFYCFYLLIRLFIHF